MMTPDELEILKDGSPEERKRVLEELHTLEVQTRVALRVSNRMTPKHESPENWKEILKNREICRQMLKDIYKARKILNSYET